MVSALVRTFGAGILAPDGTIDRQVLGEQVFSDPQKLQALNALIHPAISREAIARIGQADGHIVVVGAVLEDIGLRSAVDVLITITAPEDLLDRHTPEKHHIRAVQHPAEHYRSHSDRVIENRFDPSFVTHLRDQIGPLLA
jgi:dephospho-CoA kinase